jgi:hypothetical protein
VIAMSFDLFVYLKAVPSDIEGRFATRMRTLGMPFGLAIAEDSDEGPIWELLADGDHVDEMYPNSIQVTDELHEGFRDCTIEIHLSIPDMAMVFAVAGVLTEICGGAMQDPQMVAHNVVEEQPGLKLKLPALAETHGIYSSSLAIELAQLFKGMD